MKKTVFIWMALLLAFCSCRREVPPAGEGKTYDLSQLSFVFTIEQGSNTKGVRTGWNNGDKVFVFIQGITSAYLTVTYDGSAWSADPEVPDGMSFPTLVSSSGYLTAVYLPYGNSLTPSYSGSAWTFPGTNYYYYLKSEKSAYFITDMENQRSTLGAYLYMDTADRFVQFFLPDDEADGTIQLACNALVPAGISGVALDGTVTETTGSPGSWVTARAETIDDEEGYYASGKLSARVGLLYYFAMDKGAGDNRYKHYFKQRATALESRGAYQLPAESAWLTVSASSFVSVAGENWCTVNYGATTPWTLGTQKTSAQAGSFSSEGVGIPSDDEWDLLLDRAKTAWIQTSILGQDGFLIMDRAVQENYFFLPCADYWSSTVVSDIRHFLHTDNDGTHELLDEDPPANAYLRLLSTAYGGGFNPPDDGGDI